ncbi:MAG: DNA helicase RecQ [Bacteroidetes bacterium]|nr:MAG: DNA helicase RecQ [Bacteroidota bacterium]
MLTQQISLKDALKHHFGFDSFKGPQEEIIKSILNGNDTFVIMPTGGGKSLCYQLPALIREGTAIVISPLIALMKNQVDNIRSFGTENGIAHFLNSSLNKTETRQVKSDIEAGKTKLLYVAPESLNKEENIEFFKNINISFVAVDEAHCISEWGHDFRPEYRQIKAMVSAIGENIPIIALTATATPKVQLDIQKNLGMKNAKVFKSSFNRPNLYYEVRPKKTEKDAIKEIIKFIRQNEGKSGIIYCLSRKKVEEIAELLVANNIKALPYHAGLDSAKRARHQDMFLMEEVDVIVATIAFGMGIDKPDVRFVIHYDIPKSLEGYYQETGRAGRDGGEGKCITFYNYKDLEKLEKFLAGKPVAEQEIGKLLLMETVGYAETSICRRKHLLHYFGEDYQEDNCSNCDNCLNPKEKFEGQDIIEKLLKTILALHENYKAKHIVNVITGKNTPTIKQYKHNQLDVFGIGKDHDKIIWESAIRQALIAGLLEKDIENYGTLKVSKKGHEFLAKPHSFMLTRDHDYEKLNDEDDNIIQNTKSSGGGAADEILFKMLKDLRKKISKEQNVPPFVIFQDPSLEDMATQYPITLEELKNISGVGEGKAQRYGEPFVKLIKQYVEDNDIDRPQDLVVKSVVKKSSNKVYIIQSIDRKIPLDVIAESRGMTMDELITEIEHIIESGTKINIDYYIDDILDEEYQEEIFDFFNEEAQTGSIEEAIKELGDVYSEEEIRLMRIKYLCKMAM